MKSRAISVCGCLPMTLLVFGGCVLPSLAQDVLPATIAGPIQNPANCHLYYLLDRNTWTASEAGAVKLGGHLVTINDQAENDWVYSTFSYYGNVCRNLWIGLTDREGEGDFKWVSGEEVSFLNWDQYTPEPNNWEGKEHYVHIFYPGARPTGYPDGAWNDYQDLATFYGGIGQFGVVEVVPTAGQPPELVCPADVTVQTDSDDCSVVVSYTVHGTAQCGEVSVSCLPPPGTAFLVGSTTVECTALDTWGNSSSCSFTVTVNDATPPTVVAITTKASLVPVNTLVSAAAAFADNCGVAVADWDWGDGAVSEGAVSGAIVTGSHTYSAPGIYTLKLTLIDATGNFGEGIYQYVVVYDPNGGFVTGGGWINSPAGTYTADPSLTGKATFGFVSKYQKGATVPTGDTQFNFRTAGLDFHSTSYQWLVIAGAKAQYKGSGVINGSGDYGFLLTAIDGQVNGGGGVDKFRVKMWAKDSGIVVYDNELNTADDADPTTALSGGSIVIHKEK